MRRQFKIEFVQTQGTSSDTVSQSQHRLMLFGNIRHKRTRTMTLPKAFFPALSEVREGRPAYAASFADAPAWVLSLIYFWPGLI
jgi:hypothetical protein